MSRELDLLVLCIVHVICQISGLFYNNNVNSFKQTSLWKQIALQKKL